MKIQVSAMKEVGDPYAAFSFNWEGDQQDVFFVGSAIEEIMKLHPNGIFNPASIL